MRLEVELAKIGRHFFYISKIIVLSSTNCQQDTKSTVVQSSVTAGMNIASKYGKLHIVLGICSMLCNNLLLKIILNNSQPVFFAILSTKS